MKIWTKLVDVIIDRLTEYATYKAMHSSITKLKPIVTGDHHLHEEHKKL